MLLEASAEAVLPILGTVIFRSRHRSQNTSFRRDLWIKDVYSAQGIGVQFLRAPKSVYALFYACPVIGPCPVIGHPVICSYSYMSIISSYIIPGP